MIKPQHFACPKQKASRHRSSQPSTPPSVRRPTPDWSVRLPNARPVPCHTKNICDKRKVKIKKEMKNEEFVIRYYGKSELAMMYFPELSKESALKKFRFWLSLNPRLRSLISKQIRSYTPKQVRLIVREIGEPFDNEKDEEF